MNTIFSIEIAKDLIESQDQFPVDFDDAWTWLEFSRKDNAKRSFEKCEFVEGVDFQVFLTNEENPLGGRPTEVIKLTCECLKQWGMMSGTAKGKEIRMYFLECEKIAKQSNTPNLEPLMDAIQGMRAEFTSQLAPIQKEIAELRILSQAVNQSNGILKQANAQANNDFSNYQMLTFSDVVKTFRPYFAKVPKIISRARHSVGKVFATEQERELGKISGKYIFSGWEIQTAINCLDRAAKEVFIENHDTTLPLVELIKKMDKENNR